MAPRKGARKRARTKHLEIDISDFRSLAKIRAFRQMQLHLLQKARSRQAVTLPRARRATLTLRAPRVNRSSRTAASAASGSGNSPPGSGETSAGSSHRGGCAASAADDPPPAGRIRVRHTFVVVDTAGSVVDGCQTLTRMAS